MADEDNQRRPQWRGERKAILVRVPLPVADQLTEVAQASSESVSDTVGRLITRALAAEDTEAGSA